jgi:hypothetical protein
LFLKIPLFSGINQTIFFCKKAKNSSLIKIKISRTSLEAGR